MSKIKLRLAAFSVVGGLALASPGALAQMRSGSDGHALDASNQVGSGGINPTSSANITSLSYQNNVATENVTKGAGFRGRDVNGVDLGTGYTDPFAFRGLLAGEGVDQFIANSTGVPTMSNPTASSSTFSAPPQPFFGGANTVAPPPGFAQLPNAPGYVPAQSVAPNPNDLRIGTIDFDQSPPLPKPGEYIMPGPVDPNAPTAPTYLTYSPLYGTRAWDVNQNSDLFSGQTPLQQNATQSLTQTPEQQNRLLQLRQELNQTSGGQQNGSQNSALSIQPTMNAGTTVNNSQVQSQILQSAQIMPTNLSDQSAIGWSSQGSRQILPSSLPLPPPGQQSAQYAELLRRYQQIQSQRPKTDQEANQQFQQLMKIRQQASEAANSPMPEFSPAERHASREAVATTRASSLMAPPAFPPAPGGAPMQINSFAEGMNAKGLAALISSGESLVRHQQYDKAIGEFDQALDVAPNNPLILIGRADAELGGGYYRQASADLHDAFAADPAVLLSQYDLTKHLGPERAKALTTDLKSIADTSSADATHAFLLAYVLYNTHHEEEAAQWIDVADQRSGGEDGVLTLMKKFWNFNSSAPTVIRPAPSTQP
jgi:tetratricopeptide (TPR) repeat protein